MSKKNVLSVENMNVSFKSHGQEVKAVRGVSFSVDQGEIVGLVGESGSGKSVTMKAVMGILPDNAERTAQSLLLNGREIKDLSDEECRKVRGKEMTMIFQDPMTALNPLKKIGSQIEEVIIRQKKYSKNEAKEKALEMLKKVGIPNPEVRLGQYPHEFSGGMRQRVLIAMALACEPELLIADEPTTALDVTIQAQILDLLHELKDEFHTSIMLITHDMGVVATVCSKVIIMYGGLVMESGTVEEVFYEPKHPYTKALLKAIPSLDLKEGERLQSIPGLPPSLIDSPKGCPFAARCEYAMDVCKENPPYTYQLSDEHITNCWLQHEYAPDTDFKKEGAVAVEKGEVAEDGK